MKFSSSAEASQSEEWDVTPISSIGIPLEFGGSKQRTSPEELFAMTLANCFVATFQVIAKSSGVTFDRISVTCTTEVVKKETFVVDAALVEATVVGSDSRLQSIVEKTSRQCPIHNSVKSVVTYKFIVE